MGKFLPCEMTESYHFQEGVTDAVEMTSLFQELWSSRAAEADSYVIWQYLAFPNKMTLIFPGIKLGRKYMPEDLPWYVAK